jgi:hypothetical protein
MTGTQRKMALDGHGFSGQGSDSTGAVDAKTGGWDATSSASTSGREIPASPPLTKCEFKSFSSALRRINQPHHRNERISSFRIPHTHRPLCCCAAVQSRGTLDRQTHLLGSWAKNRSKLLLAAAGTPNQDRTPTFVLSTRPCLPVAVINISSRLRFTTRHRSFVAKHASIASALSLILFCRTSRAGHETADHASSTTPYCTSAPRGPLTGRRGSNQIHEPSWLGDRGVADEPPSKSTGQSRTLLTFTPPQTTTGQPPSPRPILPHLAPRLSPSLPFASLGIDVLASLAPGSSSSSSFWPLSKKISALALLTGPVSS